MPEVNIANLTEGLPGVVGQTNTETAGKRRWITSQGPFKIEYNFFQQADGDTFADEDTFVSQLSRPYAASVIPVNSDLNGNSFAGSADLDGDESASTFKTVTFHDCNSIAVNAVMVLVYGY